MSEDKKKILLFGIGVGIAIIFHTIGFKKGFNSGFSIANRDIIIFERED